MTNEIPKWFDKKKLENQLQLRFNNQGTPNYRIVENSAKFFFDKSCTIKFIDIEDGLFMTHIITKDKLIEIFKEDIRDLKIDNILDEI